MDRGMLRTVLAVAILFAVSPLRSYTQELQDSLRLSVLFPQDVTRLDLHYKDNEINLFRFTNNVRWILHNTDSRISSVTISAAASPEGSFEHNLELSRGRAMATMNYLMDELDLPEEAFVINAVGENWAGLRELVVRYDVPDKDAILRILDAHAGYVEATVHADESDSPKGELMALNGGRTWRWLVQNIFPELRGSSNYIVCRFSEPVKEEPAAPVILPASTDTVVVIREYIPVKDSTGMQDSRKKQRVLKEPRYRFAVGTNLLFDAVASPVIGVEFPIGRRLSIRADHQFPWYVFDNDRYAYEILNTTAEFRIWLGDRRKCNALTGWYVGIYGGAAKADLEYRSKGYQVPYTWHAGVTGGWSFPLGKRDNWHLDLGLSVGCLPYSFDYYERSETSGLLIYKYSGKGTWIGPTNIRCSLVWMLPMHKRNRDEK